MVERYNFRPDPNGLLLPFNPYLDAQVITDPANPNRKHHLLNGATGRLGLFPEGERRFEAAIRWQQKTRWI